MKPITKLYLRTFLLTGILYGMLTVGFDLADGNGFRLWKFLFLTFFFGVTMALLLVSFHKYRLKKNGAQEITEQNLGVSQKKNLKSEWNTSELIEKLKTDPIIGKMKMQEIENGIILKTGMTWISWGEEIRIILQTKRESDFDYQISSRPKLKMTLVDFGKNLENVTRIENVMKNRPNTYSSLLRS
jgi:hypothetical protein